ncbi:MAG TPA: cytochrome C [Sedimenticola thiotaurini]|uniref:Cytochrome c-type protein n=1 Tax=Sedimenticola thiotaurini TaxID=1543721 RepID=A0A831W447_9GAMM|nr:cytochrome C [Sedimenticola thiotaurini]
MTKDSGESCFTKRKLILLLLLVFVAGIVVTGLFNIGLSATNEMAFCTSCHSMKVNLEEYKETIHYKNPSGVRAVCSDCHVPKAFFPKMVAKVMAYKDVMHEILGTIDTKEKYEARRWEMASRVWAKMKATDSRECRSCHDWDQMDLSEQDRSARKRHGRARDESKTCIDCHQGIAHEEPDEPEEEDEDTETEDTADTGTINDRG